jgi:hypothetical protein
VGFYQTYFASNISVKKVFININVMAEKLVPITRLGKFFGGEDYSLDISMGQEWLEGDMNFTVVLYRIERYKTRIDDVYGESPEGGIQFLAPVEIKGYVQILAPVGQKIGTSRIEQNEPGNMRFSIYQSYLDELNVDIAYGDYLGYYESEGKVRYYTVSDDGRVVSDNKHTYGGYKPFYRTVIAVPTSQNEFFGT